MTDRDRLVLEHLPMARAIANRMIGVGGEIDREDAVQYATEGLIDAATRFDPAQGKFTTYAYPRIRGMLVDRIRAEHPWFKGSRKRLERRRRPISIDQQWDLLGLSERSGGEPPTLAETLADPATGPDVELLPRLTEQWENETLDACVDHLPAREQLVLRRYFWDGMTQEQIGLELGVSESRICQIVAKACARLRRELTPLFAEGNSDGEEDHTTAGSDDPRSHRGAAARAGARAAA